MKILGIDLAGKQENPSGLAILVGNKMKLFTSYADNEIFDLIDELKPQVIVIDAPLSLPKGRCCLEKDCKCAVGGHFRQAERDIRQYGRVLPLTFRGMKMLTLRGIKLSTELKKGYEVLESHPNTTSKILKFEDPYSGLNQFFNISSEATEHELDAGILALTGLFYLKNCYNELGDPGEGTMVLPTNEKCLEIITEF
jgi:predicted nuclease with RNAse H fold